MVLDRSSWACTIWMDQLAKDPARRFVQFSCRPSGRIWYSGNGIRWNDSINAAGPMGDRTTLFWNPFRTVWVYSVKTIYEGRRARRYWETPQLVGHPRSTWKEVDDPPLWIGADSADPPHKDMQVPCHLYALDCVAYESILLGAFVIWRGDYRNNSNTEAAQKDNQLGRPKQNSVCIGFSRDGFHWHRP